jgi:uncharacterized protein YwqG
MNNRYTDVIQSLITIMQDPMKNRFDEHVRFKIFGFAINITQVKHENKNNIRPKTLLIFSLYLDHCFCNPRF